MQLRQLLGPQAEAELVAEAERTYGPGSGEAPMLTKPVEEADLGEVELAQYEDMARRVKDKDGREVWDVMAEQERAQYAKNVQHVAETEAAKEDLVALFSALNGDVKGVPPAEAGERVLAALRREGRLTEALVAVCQDRVELAKEQEEEPEVVESLDNVLQRLKYELQVHEAPPALRLLDEVMAVLAENERPGRTGAAAVDPAALAWVQNRLARAFGSAELGGADAYGMDPLSFAAAVGHGGGGVGEALGEDAVFLTREEFAAACHELLQDVGARDLEVHREAAALEALSGGADASPESQEIDWLQRKAAVDRVRLVLSLL